MPDQLPPPVQPLFCTYFDKNYLHHGLAMFRSLVQVLPEARLYVYSHDATVDACLAQEGDPRLVVVHRSQWEDEELLAVRGQRNNAEYCWTSTPKVIEHALEVLRLPNVTYVDADLRFYSSPVRVWAAMGSNSVLITPHRYSPQYESSAFNGIYCVQFMTFRNDDRSRAILADWRRQCLRWCGSESRYGWFGDQKYLDPWTMIYEGVFECGDPGVGVAPWNLQQWTGSEMVFYHFHGLKLYSDGCCQLSGAYHIDRSQSQAIYRPHVLALWSICQEIQTRTGFSPLTQGAHPQVTGALLPVTFWWFDVLDAVKLLALTVLGRRRSRDPWEYHVAKFL